MKYNVLLLGSGGREHALAWKISQSPLLGNFYALPGNPGINSLAEGIDGSSGDFELIRRTVVEKHIDMVVCGPEDPLVNGLKDFLESCQDVPADLLFVGPGKDGAMLEGSKDFAKEFMARHGIPTAAYRTFTSEQKDDALEFMRGLRPPYVVKADGLAAGKGVIISSSFDEAAGALESIFGGRFGAAGAKVVIEEYLDGVEVSYFVLTDGHRWLMLPEAKDYKRIWDGDKGPNTGGMGSVSPVPFCDAAFTDKVVQRIIEPTVRGLESEGVDYRGFIFFGLMNCSGDPYVIEYNVRMGDPETESVMPRIGSDLLSHLAAAARGDLSGEKLAVLHQAAVTCIVVSGGYPEKYGKGYPISGIDNLVPLTVFNAGTALKDGQLVTSGGRVLAVTALGGSLTDARESVYSRIDRVSFEGAFHRSDIALDMINWPGHK
ncbi:MAG TPA: phosphoribosylamine--glycine ligase [Candidatus Coprenecus merdipullorum]|nr:phosphoribosylamine--glycine ligase [Candidatus Coprenecus merdipullorum]